MKSKKITILGMGRSGIAALRLAASRGIHAVGIDENKNPVIPRNLTKNTGHIKLLTGFNEPCLPDSDIILISPGIPPSSHLAKLAEKSKSPIISEIEFAANFAEKPIIAITGTNGKTTVTEMTAALLGNAVPCGNIGLPLSEAVLMPDIEYLVVEVSSFQLEKSAKFAPYAAALLNISSDHMDRYPDFDAYKTAKFALFPNVTLPENMIINYNLLPEWRRYFPDVEVSPLTFSALSRKADIHLEQDGKTIVLDGKQVDVSRIHGKHNIENFMAAAMLAGTVIRDRKRLPEEAQRLAESFSISPHRQEEVAVINGVKYINDSKATNPDALAAALEEFGIPGKKNIILIAGGLDKKMIFSPITEYADRIRQVCLIGEAKHKLYSAWHEKIQCRLCGCLEDAIVSASDTAMSGDIVMLSPGCASMDMFADYRERGEFFRKIVLQTDI